MGFVVVEQKRWQRVHVLFLELEGQILQEVVEAPFMGTFFKLDVVAVAEGLPNAAVNSESTPLILALGYRNSKVLVFWVPGPLLNQLCVESSPETNKSKWSEATYSSKYSIGTLSLIIVWRRTAKARRISAKSSGGCFAELSVRLVNLYFTPCTLYMYLMRSADTWTPYSCSKSAARCGKDKWACFVRHSLYPNEKYNVVFSNK